MQSVVITELCICMYLQDISQGDAVDVKYTGWVLDNHTFGQVGLSNGVLMWLPCQQQIT